MTDLISRLRALSRHEHDDLTIGDEAAYEIARLRVDHAAAMAAMWKRVAELKQLSNDRWRENERLRTVLQRIAEFPRQRNDELSIEGAREQARAALKEPT